MPERHSPPAPLEALLVEMGLPFGLERSFKIRASGLVADRVLCGVPAIRLSGGRLLAVTEALGMPAAARPLLDSYALRADVALFGAEHGPDGSVVKVYLQLRDECRQKVRVHGPCDPQLLYLGIKWNAGSPEHRRADYTCHPRLSPGRMIARMNAIYGPAAGVPTHELATRLLDQSAARSAVGAFAYVELAETGSCRRSFDVNLYPATMAVADARPLLMRCGRALGIADRLDEVLHDCGAQPLGHLSAGIDGRGREYATVYYEASPLPSC